MVGDLRNAYINRFSGDDLDGVAAFAYYPYSNSVGGDTFYVAPGEVSTNASFAEDTRPVNSAARDRPLDRPESPL